MSAQVEAHLGRQRLARDLFERRERLRRAVPGTGDARDLGGAVEVEAVGELRAARRRGGHERVERHHLPPCPAHEEEPELLGIAPELRLRLDVHLVDAAEPVEVVHVGAAEERAERRVDVLQRRADLQHLRAIDVGVDLRHRRAVERCHTPDLGPLAGRLHEALRLLGQEIGRPADPILQLHREARAGPEAGNSGRTEGDDDALPESVWRTSR